MNQSCKICPFHLLHWFTDFIFSKSFDWSSWKTLAVSDSLNFWIKFSPDSPQRTRLGSIGILDRSFNPVSAARIVPPFCGYIGVQSCGIEQERLIKGSLNTGYCNVCSVSAYRVKSYITIWTLEWAVVLHDPKNGNLEFFTKGNFTPDIVDGDELRSSDENCSFIWEVLERFHNWHVFITRSCKFIKLGWVTNYTSIKETMVNFYFLLFRSSIEEKWNFTWRRIHNQKVRILPKHILDELLDHGWKGRIFCYFYFIF